MSDVYSDQAIFDAIIAATKDQSLSCGQIVIDTKKFIETFNGHRDRKLCTSLDVAQTPERSARLLADAQRIIAEYKAQAIEAARQPPVYDAMEAALEMSKPGVERMMAAVENCRVDQCQKRLLLAALREIAAMCPATSDMTLAHAMAQIAEEAISGEGPSRVETVATDGHLPPSPSYDLKADVEAASKRVAQARSARLLADNIIEECAKIADAHWEANGKVNKAPGWDSACLLIARAIRDLKA